MVRSVENLVDSFNKRFIPSGITQKEWTNMSLAEQIKVSFKRDTKKIQLSPWPSRLGMVYVWLGTLTYLYVMLRYVIPEYCEAFSDTSRYFLKLIVTITGVQSLANWLCMYFYKSVHRMSPDNPPEEALTPITVTIDSGPQTEHGHSNDGASKTTNTISNVDTENGVRTVTMLEDIYSCKTGLLWGYCDACDLPKPPRAHHCKVCNACILKRDHHCYFANTCIGFHNQRYFVVFLFYMMTGCLIGLCLQLVYLRWKLAEASWWAYVLPVTLYKSVVLGELPLYYTCMMVHMYSFVPIGLMCAGLLLTQIALIASGKTTYELTRHEQIKPLKDSAHNFRSVFGAFWAINFIFPAVLIFRQEGNGKIWSDMKKY